MTISSWQRSVERYVWDEGNGDPNVLRDLSWDDVHKGFAIMSDPEPARSIDAIGLLLGHRRVGQTGCFIFLVALVDHQHLEELRPVALYFEAGQFHWIVGPSDQQALSTYRRDNPGGTPGPPSHGPVFPRQADAFSLDVQGEQISIMDQSSGASWKLAVPPPLNGAIRLSGGLQFPFHDRLSFVVWPVEPQFTGQLRSSLVPRG